MDNPVQPQGLNSTQWLAEISRQPRPDPRHRLAAFNKVLDDAFAREENRLDQISFASIAKDTYSVIFFRLKTTDEIGEHVDLSIKVDADNQPIKVHLSVQKQLDNPEEEVYSWELLTDSLTTMFHSELIAEILNQGEQKIIKLHGGGGIDQPEQKGVA